ncbi:7736_t:CDS:10 [Diversispora eburnea]|uniref:7736_t:CDS:1 n=2 Tax=Diversisporales TaxID=214509 RepID=A0A9N8W796_9GLOM|nr:7736_t:CDS:10 [Diversispora eburnea]
MDHIDHEINIEKVVSIQEKLHEGDFSDEISKRRNKIIQSSVSTSSSKKNPVWLEFHGVNYSILKKKQSNSESWWNKFTNLFSRKDKQLDVEIGKIDNKKFIQIIQNIHGCANPGEILAIMGPSGCGKTTLLNILGNRVGKQGVSGTINLNGNRIIKETKRFVAYCSQNDIFFPQLTVRETLSFTARLRLPREMSRSEKLKQVENTIQLLNLSKCADTKIGDNRVRGVSGGEKKRVSIACELLTDPNSSLALELGNILKGFAKEQHKTIVMVIHQPSSQVFELFDKLLLMADGHVVYYGERADLVDYLTTQGYKCHPNFNPADYILELLNDPKSKQKLIQAYMRHLESDITGEKVVHKYSNRIRDIPSIILTDETDDIIQSGPLKIKHKWEATFLQQFIILTERSFKQRSKVILSKLDLIQTFSLAFFCCLVWFQLPYDEKDIVDRYGSIFFTCTFWSFHPMINTITSFPLDLEVLKKERQSRSYRLLAYFLSKQSAELILAIIHPIFYVTIVYWVSGLIPNGSIIVSSLIAQSFGYLFGAAFLNVQKALIIATVFMLTTMLLGGFYVQSLPEGLSWMKYLSFSYYGYSLLMHIQFTSPLARFKCNIVGPASSYLECLHADDVNDKYVSGNSVIELLGLNTLKWYEHLMAMFGFIIIIRIEFDRIEVKLQLLYFLRSNNKKNLDNHAISFLLSILRNAMEKQRNDLSSNMMKGIAVCQGDGKKTDSYKVVLPFNINDHTYYYGHSTDTNHWYIQELLENDGIMEEETSRGNLKSSFHDLTPFQIFDRPKTTNGTWTNSYPMVFSANVKNKPYIFAPCYISKRMN